MAVSLDREEEELLAEIPSNISGIMAEDPQLALDWRMKTRELFESYFEHGYSVVAFHQAEGRAFYRLKRQVA